RARRHRCAARADAWRRGREPLPPPDAGLAGLHRPFGSTVLTFLAGMEVDPAYMRRRLGPSLGLGVVSFVGPFAVTSLVSYFLLDSSIRASLIAGTALSTTSLAVVYAVLVERGLSHTAAGKLLMSATF